MGSLDDDSKTKRGGFAAISKKPREFLVCDEFLLDGNANFYGIIKDHLDFRVQISNTSRQFFLGAKRKAGTKQSRTQLFF